MAETVGEQVLARIKRVKRAGYHQDTSSKCLACGKVFQDCKHSMAEVRSLVDAVKYMDWLS